MPKNPLAKPLSNNFSFQRELLLGGLVFIFALMVRWPTMGQSLWYDEMFSLIHYIARPWEQVLAGHYSPNNHVLFTAIAKLLTPEDVPLDLMTMCIRLPSLMAGAALPLALAWPLRRERPLAALLIALIAAVHPWSVCFSGWARGYALVLLLSVLATLLLPGRKRIVDWAYAICAAAAMYTLPIAAGVVLGHMLVMLTQRRELLLVWIRSVSVAAILTICLYMPFFGGTKEYWSKPEQPSVGYMQFLEQSLRFSHAGQNAAGVAAIAVPLLVLIPGGILAWRLRAMRSMLVTFAAAAGFAMLIPLAIPLAGETRAALWLIPLYCMGAAGVVTAAMNPDWRRWLALGVMAALVVNLGFGTYAILATPGQPIRESIELARQLAGDKGCVIGVYMGAAEAKALYGNIDAKAYRLGTEALGDANIPSLMDVESEAVGPVVAVVFFEGFVKRDTPQLWRSLQERYTLVRRLPGRISPVGVYRRK